MHGLQESKQEVLKKCGLRKLLCMWEGADAGKTRIREVWVQLELRGGVGKDDEAYSK